MAVILSSVGYTTLKSKRTTRKQQPTRGESQETHQGRQKGALSVKHFPGEAWKTSRNRPMHSFGDSMTSMRQQIHSKTWTHTKKGSLRTNRDASASSPRNYHLPSNFSCRVSHGYNQTRILHQQVYRVIRTIGYTQIGSPHHRSSQRSRTVSVSPRVAALQYSTQSSNPTTSNTGQLPSAHSISPVRQHQREVATTVFRATAANRFCA